MKTDAYSTYLKALRRALANMEPVSYDTHAELAAAALGAIDAQNLKTTPLASPRSREDLEQHVAALTK